MAGLSTMEFMDAWLPVSPHAQVKGSDERNNRLSDLVAEALKEERE